ncbi:MAG: NAD-dependent epimerase/dehydratase family protein [Opitutales bacterium]
MRRDVPQIATELPPSVMIFGCGYIGAALAERLIESGVRVGALTRNPEQVKKLRAMGVHEVLQADVHETAWQEQIAGGYQAIVNCVSSAGGGLEGYRLSYLEGQKRILEWASVHPPQTYIYTSSSSVYPQDGGVLVDEEADTREAPATGQVLLESERLLADAAIEQSWYVLRLAGIYGPGRHYLLDQLRKASGPIPGRGDYSMNMIHRDDAVAAILCALSGGAPSGIYNICDNEPCLKEEVLGYLASQMGLPEPSFDPSRISERLKRRGGRMPDRRITNRKARELLGWAPEYPSYRQGYGALLDSGKG